ncbi:MAG: extracellular solute-binding protein [Actinobacteria bacterium]|nr:extracellular solute-binding protein [Actinomycetota bacterium]
MKRYRYHALALMGLTALAVSLAAVAAGGTASSPSAAPKVTAGAPGSVSVISEATGPEQKSFQAVLARFQQKTKIKVKYTSAGRQLVTILSTAVQGGNPPDVALLPQPGLMRDFANRKALKPITFLRGTIVRDWSPGWLQLGTVNKTLYGLYYKGANKSTVWYNVGAFREAGVQPPKTFPQLLQVASTLRASGTAPFSIGGADGWTLTDLFENIYLRQAGGKKYDQLAAHTIKWTDPSVKAALRTMGQILQANNVAGGTQGAVQTDFATSVTQAFSEEPKAAMVIEADFVAGVITGSTKAKPRTDFNVFSFPSIKGSPPSVVGGGDAVVMFKDTPASRALLRYLATPEAAEIWARRGGFSSPNKRVKASVYSDALTRQTASELAKAKVFRFDLSDLQPSAFGGTVGQGLFKLFQDFLKNPNNVDGIARQMETAAARAYKK